jgi:hypothetical protein
MRSPRAGAPTIEADAPFGIGADVGVMPTCMRGSQWARASGRLVATNATAIRLLQRIALNCEDVARFANRGAMAIWRIACGPSF